MMKRPFGVHEVKQIASMSLPELLEADALTSPEQEKDRPFRAIVERVSTTEELAKVLEDHKESNVMLKRDDEILCINSFAFKNRQLTVDVIANNSEFNATLNIDDDIDFDVIAVVIIDYY